MDEQEIRGIGDCGPADGLFNELNGIGLPKNGKHGPYDKCPVYESEHYYMKEAKS